MRKLIALVGTAVVLAGLGFVLSPASAAAPPCQGQGTDYTGTIVVPSGTTCNLQGPATLTGSVIVNPGGRLVVGSAQHITGSITANQAGTDTADLLGTGPFSFSVVMCNAIVDGGVNVSRSASDVLIGGGACGPNHIGGTVNLSGNKVVTLDNDQSSCSALVAPCTIGGSAFLSNNGQGVLLLPVQVSDNHIAGTLGCQNNSGITGANNVATSKTGQCASF